MGLLEDLCIQCILTMVIFLPTSMRSECCLLQVTQSCAAFGSFAGWLDGRLNNYGLRACISRELLRGFTNIKRL